MTTKKKRSGSKNCPSRAIAQGAIPGTKKFFQCCPSKSAVPKCHIFDPVKAALYKARSNKALAARRRKAANKAQRNTGAAWAANINRGRIPAL